MMSRIRTVLEDSIFYAPNPFFRAKFFSDYADPFLAVKQLKLTGSLNLGLFFPKSICLEIRHEMDKVFSGKRSEVRSKINSHTGIFHIIDSLSMHPAIAQFATHPYLLAVIERYLRRRIYLADIDIRRVLPISMKEVDNLAGTKGLGYTSSHWHRDIRGRQVKIMIYLTDVGQNDSNFSYLPKTHTGRHIRPSKVESSRFTENEIANLGVPMVDCCGPAGTTLIFDTNLIHRLRRKSGASIRDSITFYYTPGQELRAIDIPPEILKSVAPSYSNIFGGQRQG